MEGICVFGGLASRRMLWVLVDERHAERAARARVEEVHVTLHIIRCSPRRHSVRVEAGLVYGLARRLDYLGDPRACTLDGWFPYC
jgi:hypothetical protein